MPAMSKASAFTRRLLIMVIAVAITCSFLLFVAVAALTQPTTPLTPPPTTPAPITSTSAPAPAGPVSPAATAAPTATTGLIDPAQLESLQPSIVGLVIQWEEPESSGPYAFLAEPTRPGPMPAMSFCTGWFSDTDTIVTAGHCVVTGQVIRGS